MTFQQKDDICPSLDGSNLRAQGLETNTLDSFTIFRDEEEMLSNVAVGAASPFLTIQSPTVDGLHSSGFLPPAEASADEEDDADNSHAAMNGEPEYLALNQENLAQFESSVQKGNVPLRTDVVGNTYVDARAARLAMAAARMETRGVANPHQPIVLDTPLDAVTRNQPCLIHVDTISVSDITNHVTQGSENKELTTVSPITRTSRIPSRPDLSKTNVSTWDNVSTTFGGDSGTGSTRPQGDLLNEQNLQRHLHKLNSGGVAPLKTDTVPLALPSTSAPLWLSRAGHGGGEPGPAPVPRPPLDPPSLCCEPSDAVAGSETPSTAPSQRHHPGSTGAAPAEELWSMETEGETEGGAGTEGGPAAAAHPRPGHGPALSRLPAWPSLNKRSLRRLRRQIESGKVPLRPEVLAGLSGIDLRLRRVAEKSPSTFVEVPSEDLNSQGRQKTGGAQGNLGLSPYAPDGANASSGTQKKNHMMLRSPPLGGLISDTAGLSFCSISVEASGRERIGETVSANECSSIDHDARFRDDEDGMFLAYDLSAIHDEVCYLRRQMTELTQNLKRSRADQELLVQQMKGMQEDMLVNLHCLKLTPLKDVQNNILILQNQLEALQALVLNSQYVKDSRNGSSTQVTADLPPLRVASSENDTARIRLNLKLDLDRHFLAGATNPPSSASPPSEVFIFILMARPTDSVGSVKEQLLKRLSANKILPENSPISASNTFLFFDEKVLFDTDLLGQDLQMKLAPEGEYTLTLRRKT